MPKKTRKPKKIGLALGGGGTVALAHIGILQVLEEAGIRIDYICGTSMGAIIGGLYASGVPLKKLEKFAHDIVHKDLIRFKNFNVFHESLFKFEEMSTALRKLTGKKKIEDCKIPFAAVAIEIESGKEKVFNKGPLLEAILASSAIPFIFPPVFHQGEVYVDGGLLNNVPTNLLKNKKLDITIGVEIQNYKARQNLSGELFKHYYGSKYKNLLKQSRFFGRLKENLQLWADITLRSFEIAASQNTKIHLQKAKPDLLLKPEIEIGLLEFKEGERAVELGRAYMKKELPRLLALL